MADPKKYYLHITAGPSYDESTYQEVLVNTAEPVIIDSPDISVKLNVRIQNFRGLPKSSPSTCDYFSNEPHKSDLYSIQFSFTPKRDINGNDLLFGNDFNRPIKDNLPYGFGTALRIVRWSIDPGLDGDVYADKPYLYGPLLSSINVLYIGDKTDGETQPHETADGEFNKTTPLNDEDKTTAPTEGGTDPDGSSIRDENHIPSTPSARMRHFLTQSNREAFTFEAGRTYTCDFFNPYLDFNELSLKLPGITLPLMRFWDGQPLRYTLKVRGEGGADGADCSRGGKELMCVLITLVPEDDAQAVENQWRHNGAGSGEDNAGPTAAAHPSDSQTANLGSAQNETNEDDVD